MHSGGVNKTDTAQTAPNDTIKFTPLFGFMATEVIGHHDVAGLQGRTQHFLDIAQECLAVHRTIQKPRSLWAPARSALSCLLLRQSHQEK
jgi:hypothetical protein